jgi:antitoxin (DNA-binding transcriptional repressor) of toxin-antitoxin stability system
MIRHATIPRCRLTDHGCASGRQLVTTPLLESGYNMKMEVGIKQAKTDLSKLIVEAQQGKRVFLMNRGKRIAEIVPVRAEATVEKDNRGLGMLKDKVRLPPGWGTQKERRQSTDEILQLMGIEH